MVVEGRLTVSLIIICIIIFFVQSFVNLSILSFVPDYFSTYPWTILSSLFLHADIFHLAFNMFALLLFGVQLERVVKRKLFLTVFLLSGVIGNLSYMLMSSNSTIPVVGASGGIYGIIGTLAVLTPYARVWIWYMPVPIMYAAIIWGVSEFLGLFTPSSIAYSAHLGGLITGVVSGVLIKSVRKREKSLF